MVGADQVPYGPGPALFLWDWHDRTLADRTNDENRRNPDAGAFVLRALAYKPNTGDEPPDCLNCHVERGGERGGPARIFPNQPGTGSLPFEVRQGGTRKWAALSKAHACRTGVLFNPSRIAKDTYRITVMLANQLSDDGSKPAIDVGGKTDILLNNNPGLPHAQTGMLELIRQVNARYIRKAAYAAINIGLISQVYEVAGVHLEWLNQIDPTFTGLWTQVEYNHYLQEAIAMRGANYSDQQLRDRRYSNTIPQNHENLRDKRYTSIAKAVAKNILGQYDQWFGCPQGQTLPQANEVCLVFPAKDVIAAPLRDQAIQTYINKPRRINDKLKKWNQLKNANLATPDPVLRLQFYNNVLKAGERRKIETETERLYTAAGWRQFDELDDAGHPQGQEPYWIRLPDGAIREGSLDDDGLVRMDWIPPGVCLVKFPRIDGNECELPVYTSEPAATWIELHVIDQNNQPLGGEPYSIQLPNGEVRQGKLDSNGMARIEGIAPGMCTVRFPNIDRSEWVLPAKPSSREVD